MAARVPACTRAAAALGLFPPHPPASAGTACIQVDLSTVAILTSPSPQSQYTILLKLRYRVGGTGGRYWVHGAEEGGGTEGVHITGAPQ